MKHIDFVLCDLRSSAVRLAIELDDRSHDRPERRSRDHFVNDLLAVVGIPILHVKARQSYDAAILRAGIRKRLPR